jgi:PAS domain S-box-containing protein
MSRLEQPRKSKEVRCTTQEVIITRTDLNGNIIYCNPTFTKVNGFKGTSVIDKPHNIIRHPDMPKAIFKIIWSIIEQGLPIQAIVKNRTNDGHYYWTLINWKIQKNRDHQTISYIAYAKQAPDHAIKAIEPIYEMMLAIEKRENINASLEYLHLFLEEEKLSYKEYMEKLTKNREFRCLCDFIKHLIIGK